VIRVVVDDLAFLPSDAIVRPATSRLDATTPAVRRLEAVGGAEFADRLHVHKELGIGSAVVTGGGGLPAEFVIHAVIRSKTEPVSPSGVRQAWASVLRRAVEWEFPRITTPPLGIGAGNLSVEDAAEIMVGVLRVHLAQASFPAEVSFVVETEEEREVFEAILKRSAVGLS
jgi:O-acetyl-ADP-ribose deacetylase